MEFQERFPPELCYHIIDFLHDDRETLLSCAPVCRSWLPVVQSYLFSRLELYYTNETADAIGQRWYRTSVCSETLLPRYERLERLLSTSQGVAGCIRSLQLRVLPKELDPHHSYDPAFVACLHSILCIVVQQNKLREIEFCSDSGALSIGFNIVPEGLLEILYDLFHIESLRFATFAGWLIADGGSAMLWALIQPCRNLIGLSVVDVETQTWNVASELAAMARVWDTGPRFLAWNSTEIYTGEMDPCLKKSVRNLQELEVASWVHSGGVQTILSTAGQRLERLHLDEGDRRGPFIPLSDSSGLRSIWLTSRKETALAWVVGTLLTIPNLGRLERIAIEMQRPLAELQNSWKILCGFLSVATLTSLQRIDVCVDADVGGQEFAVVLDTLEPVKVRGLLRVRSICQLDPATAKDLMPLSKSFHHCSFYQFYKDYLKNKKVNIESR